MRSWPLREVELKPVWVGSMAVGLGVSSREWEELKRSVDDSFWVLRVIGMHLPTRFL